MRVAAPASPTTLPDNPVLPADIVQAAVTHFVMLQSTPTDAQTCQRCAAWRAADPRHEQAWQRIQALTYLQDPALPLHGPAARQALLVPNRRRRHTLGLLLAASGAGLLGLSASPPNTIRSAWADYRSRVGERHEIILDDGTNILLNTDTAINILVTDSTRRIELLGGEIMIASASKTSSRLPLQVQTRFGTVTPLGTRFAVRDTDTWQACIMLYEGLLSLQPDSGSTARILHAGQQAILRQDRVDAIEPLDPGSDAWKLGLLLAERMPLAQCLKELSRYRHGILRCDPDIATLPVSGTFPLDRTDEALSMLAQVFNLQAVYRTHWWITLRRA